MAKFDWEKANQRSREWNRRRSGAPGVGPAVAETVINHPVDRSVAPLERVQAARAADPELGKGETHVTLTPIGPRSTADQRALDYREKTFGIKLNSGWTGPALVRRPAQVEPKQPPSRPMRSISGR